MFFPSRWINFVRRSTFLKDLKNSRIRVNVECCNKRDLTRICYDFIFPNQSSSCFDGYLTPTLLELKNLSHAKLLHVRK